MTKLLTLKNGIKIILVAFWLLLLFIFYLSNENKNNTNNLSDLNKKQATILPFSKNIYNSKQGILDFTPYNSYYIIKAKNNSKGFVKHSLDIIPQGYETKEATLINLKFLTYDFKIKTFLIARSDKLFNLLSFEYLIYSKYLQVKLSGHRQDEKNFILALNLNNKSVLFPLKLAKGPNILSNFFYSIAVQGLKLYKEYRMETFDFYTLSTKSTTAQIVSIKMIKADDGQLRPIFKLNLITGNTPAIVWLDHEGRMIEYENSLYGSIKIINPEDYPKEVAELDEPLNIKTTYIDKEILQNLRIKDLDALPIDKDFVEPLKNILEELKN